ESEEDLLDLAFALRDLDVDSVPVNFLDARPGTPLAGYPLVEPGFALRALCMFRFVHPRTDLRVAGGREITLRALQVMALYPANSIFTQGYLTTPGATPHDDHRMIRDAGFELELEPGVADHPVVVMRRCTRRRQVALREDRIGGIQRHHLQRAQRDLPPARDPQVGARMDEPEHAERAQREARLDERIARERRARPRIQEVDRHRV